MLLPLDYLPKHYSGDLQEFSGHSPLLSVTCTLNAWLNDTLLW